MEHTRNSKITRLVNASGGGAYIKASFIVVTYRLLHSIVVLDGTYDDTQYRLRLGVLCADEVQHAAEAMPTYLLASLKWLRLVLARGVNIGTIEE